MGHTNTWGTSTQRQQEQMLPVTNAANGWTKSGFFVPALHLGNQQSYFQNILSCYVCPWHLFSHTGGLNFLSSKSPFQHWILRWVKNKNKTNKQTKTKTRRRKKDQDGKGFFFFFLKSQAGEVLFCSLNSGWCIS